MNQCSFCCLIGFSVLSIILVYCGALYWWVVEKILCATRTLLSMGSPKSTQYLYSIEMHKNSIEYFLFYIIIVKGYLLCRKYFFSSLKLYGLCEELAIRLKYDGNNRKNIGSDSTWWLLPFGVIEMMMTSAWGGCASAQGWQLQQDAINVSLKGGHSQQRIFPLQFLWKEELTWSLRKYRYVTP